MLLSFCHPQFLKLLLVICCNFYLGLLYSNPSAGIVCNSLCHLDKLVDKSWRGASNFYWTYLSGHAYYILKHASWDLQHTWYNVLTTLSITKFRQCFLLLRPDQRILVKMRPWQRAHNCLPPPKLPRQGSPTGASSGRAPPRTRQQRPGKVKFVIWDKQAWMH